MNEGFLTEHNIHKNNDYVFRKDTNDGYVLFVKCPCCDNSIRTDFLANIEKFVVVLKYVQTISRFGFYDTEEDAQKRISAVNYDNEKYKVISVKQLIKNIYKL